jgi:hypothetical protein
MSYDTPQPEVETNHGPKEAETQPITLTKPDDVNTEDGTDEKGMPVENPSG